MENFRIAVKSFIINKDNNLFLIKRIDNDSHSPGVWEIPGGRLEIGENPFEGLKRETKEETGMDIEVMNPLSVAHFTRDDGQDITLITFLCKPLSESIKLSEEHVEYSWENLKKARDKLHKAFHKDIDAYEQYFSRKIH